MPSSCLKRLGQCLFVDVNSRGNRRRVGVGLVAAKICKSNYAKCSVLVHRHYLLAIHRVYIARPLTARLELFVGGGMKMYRTKLAKYEETFRSRVDAQTDVVRRSSG